MFGMDPMGGAASCRIPPLFVAIVAILLARGREDWAEDLAVGMADMLDWFDTRAAGGHAGPFGRRDGRPQRRGADDPAEPRGH